MDTEQARRFITLHDNADRALANLRNAGAMSTDDPRATELLEGAGDAYAQSIAALWAEQSGLTEPSLADVVRLNAGMDTTVAEDKLSSETVRGGGLAPDSSPNQPTGTAPGTETPAAVPGQVQQAERKTNAEAPAPPESVLPAPQGDPKGRDEGNPPAAA